MQGICKYDFIQTAPEYLRMFIEIYSIVTVSQNSCGVQIRRKCFKIYEVGNENFLPAFPREKHGPKICWRPDTVVNMKYGNLTGISYSLITGFHNPILLSLPYGGDTPLSIKQPVAVTQGAPTA